MSVRIQFDKPNEWHFTNLDFVTGKVILILQADAAISAINVKLEGESRTRLAGPKQPYNDRSDKKRTELEVHKLIYKVVTVFPATEVQSQSPSSTQYTLLAGHYEYPFRFKFPFNNNCSTNSSLLRDLKLGSLSVQYSVDQNKHVKRTLPPTLSGFPGEAEIKYYVKATVVRPKFYQENVRHQIDIKFLPIEPPRPPHRHEENFARRKQQFQKYPSLPAKGLGTLFKKSSIPAVANGEEPPIFQVDARLPNPAILTCNQPLPLRILVQKLNDANGTAYLSMLQLELIAHTHIRAHDLTRTETSSSTLVSLTNMNMPFSNAADKTNREWKIPARFWDNKPLPNTIAPSFKTCNISRGYELEVRVGLAHAVGGGGVLPELIVLPLRFPVKVFSGIAPPADLLTAMAQNGHFHLSETGALANAPPHAYEPITPTTPTYEQSQYPAQIGSYGPRPPSVDPDDAPPSYEDAMAEEIGPVDGPRHEYTVPVDPEQRDDAFNSDSKGSGIGRRLSERLFSTNGLVQPRRNTFGSTTTVEERSPVQEESLSAEDTGVTVQSPISSETKGERATTKGESAI